MEDRDWLAGLRQFRQDNRLTQHDLAAFLGVSQKTVSRWERGVDQPGPEVGERLRQMLDGDRGPLPAVFDAVRGATVPLALVNGQGEVLVASASYLAARPAVAARGAEASSVAVPTVLVVEDDEAVLRATQAVLKRWNFLDVGATDGATAVALVQNGKVAPMAAIIDFLLPGTMDGVDTAQALRASLPDLPVLIISGEATPERMRKITASGLTFLAKPVDPQELRTALAVLVGRTGDPGGG